MEKAKKKQYRYAIAGNCPDALYYPETYAYPASTIDTLLEVINKYFMKNKIPEKIHSPYKIKSNLQYLCIT